MPDIPSGAGSPDFEVKGKVSLDTKEAEEKTADLKGAAEGFGGALSKGTKVLTKFLIAIGILIAVIMAMKKYQEYSDVIFAAFTKLQFAFEALNYTIAQVIEPIVDPLIDILIDAIAVLAGILRMLKPIFDLLGMILRVLEEVIEAIAQLVYVLSASMIDFRRESLEQMYGVMGKQAMAAVAGHAGQGKEAQDILQSIPKGLTWDPNDPTTSLFSAVPWGLFDVGGQIADAIGGALFGVGPDPVIKDMPGWWNPKRGLKRFSHYFWPEYW